MLSNQPQSPWSIFLFFSVALTYSLSSELLCRLAFNLVWVRRNAMTVHRGNFDIWPIPPLLLGNQIIKSVAIDQSHCDVDFIRIRNRERVIAFIFLTRS